MSMSVRSIHEAKDQVVESTQKAAQKVDEEVHRNPWMFIGIAAFVSVIFGFILGRKSK